jgi:hypothetical protein
VIRNYKVEAKGYGWADVEENRDEYRNKVQAAHQ